MVGRRPEARGGGRGGGSYRDLSPNPPLTLRRIEDHRPDWHHRPDDRRPRLSVSPPSRPRHSPACRNTSVERRDYAARHSDHHPPPSQPRRRPSPFKGRNYELPPSYMLPDHPSDLNQDLNSSRLKPKPIFSDDGAARTVHSLPTNSIYAALKTENIIGSSGGALTGGYHDGGVLRYRNHVRNPYEEREREKLYSRDVSYQEMPPLPLRPIEGASSSAIVKDELFHLYGDRLHQPSDGPLRGSLSRHVDDTSDQSAYHQMQLSDPMKRVPFSHSSREESRDYTIHGRFLASDDIYKKVPDYRDSLGGSSSFTRLLDAKVEGAAFSRKTAGEGSFLDPYHSIRGDSVSGYREAGVVDGDYAGRSGIGHPGFVMKPSHNHEIASVDDSYRGRPKSPVFPDRCKGLYWQDVSPPQGKTHVASTDIYDYDLSSKRMIRRKYLVDDDANGFNSRNVFPDDRTAYRGILLRSGGNDVRPYDDREGHMASKKMAFHHSLHKMSSRKILKPDVWLRSEDSTAYEDGGHSKSIKRRLRPGPSEFHGSFTLERKEFKPNKFRKKTLEDRHDGRHTIDGDVAGADALLRKEDPPEGSEEFKQLFHKAFLRFTKLLNESSRQQKRYREPGRGPLLCCVCGSLSKDFSDTHSLLAHTYHARKGGLRTDHLGLHKALCVLMGWNWRVAPDTSRAYESSSAVVEAKALRDDLILWPPLVIIHNSSIGIKVSADKAKIVTTEQMEELLREIGVGAGKARVSYGKPANQSVFIVKFSPTFSGLQEAEKLHKYFADKKRGKQEFQQLTTSGEKVNFRGGENIELLYGFMAVAEDLDKLDPETKKRSLVKSRKDIEAIADAPLNAD
ncbi:uncharacterized protein LOC109723606 [Ananas comosus]|nr:uncharacterized protein LOC109723606 [Ananas comosus]XP_020107634.1 uncharacterized protein LOC109723606 [Ananas comosus]